MKEAGCRLIIPGFESGVQQILNNMKKGITIEQSFEFAKNANKAGLLVHGCFMVGNPGETWKTMHETLKFAAKLNLDTAQFFPMIPYPGTEAYDWATKNAFLKSLSFDKWLTEDGLHNTIIDIEGLSADDLTGFCDYARRRYYLRPRYFLYKLKQFFSNYQEAKRTWKSLKIFFKHLMPSKHS